jgi:hypothetical protein
VVDLSLVNYIQQLLQSGYDINAIKGRLITSGYDLNLVTEAVNYVSKGPQTEAPKPGFLDRLKSRKFIVVLSAILLLVILSFVILMFAGGEPLPIGVYVSTASSQVNAGEELSFAKSVSNLEGRGMVSLSYEVTGTLGGVVAAHQEKFSADSIPRMTSIAIPEDAPDGSYTLKVIAGFGEQKAESALAFTVVGKNEEPEELPEEGPPAPGEDEADNDHDGIPDSTDPDDDNDGIPDDEDDYPFDHDNDGIPDSMDNDDDDDGILDKFDYYLFDRDNDGIADDEDEDNDNDGIADDEDDYPFDYDNDGVVDKDDDDKSYEIPPEAAMAFACANNIDCNDFDICTADACVEGTCEYEAQSPCCGDFICEGGETPSDCPQDCEEEAPPGPAPPAGNGAPDVTIGITDPEAAAKECSEITRQEPADRCYLELAKATGNNAFCEQIFTETIKDSCYMYFVMNFNQFGLCDRIVNRYLQNTCYSMEGLAELEALT